MCWNFMANGMCWNFMAKEWPMVMESAESSALLSYVWSKAGLDAAKFENIWKTMPSNSNRIQIHHCLYVQVDISQHSLRNRDISQKASSCDNTVHFGPSNTCDLINNWDLQRRNFIQLTSINGLVLCDLNWMEWRVPAFSGQGRPKPGKTKQQTRIK